MDCKQAKSVFINYYDGDLEQSERAAFEKHLGDCKVCQAEWDDYQKTMSEISGLHHLGPSEDFVFRVKKTIDRRSKGRFFGEQSHYSLRFAIVSFVLILFFMIAYIFVSSLIEIQIMDSEEDAGANSVDTSEAGVTAPKAHPEAAGNSAP